MDEVHPNFECFFLSSCDRDRGGEKGFNAVSDYATVAIQIFNPNFGRFNITYCDLGS